MIKQICFDFHHIERLDWNDFIESNENRDVITYLTRWHEWNVRSLIIYGESGVGKTHLASLWSQSANAICIHSDCIKYDPREMFMNDCNFVIDDFDGSPDFVQSKWLFHFINILNEKRRFMVIISRTPPSEWKVDLPDLKSRLLLIPSKKILSPSDDLLFKITQKLSKDFGISLNDKCIQYILNNVTRDVNTVKKVLSVLNKLSLEEKQTINLAFIRKYLHTSQEHIES